MEKIISPVTGREVKLNKEWEKISGRRWNKITHAVNNGIPKNEVNPPLSDAESELYDSIAEDLVDYRKKYGEDFMFDECAELEW